MDKTVCVLHKKVKKQQNVAETAAYAARRFSQITVANYVAAIDAIRRDLHRKAGSFLCLTCAGGL